ncbi:MAG: amino acid permease [Chlamydiales bacterium]|nr:amino acid permease [Chlamydiales bacterium]
MKKPQKKISLFLLVLLIVSAIDSIRNLPAASLFGSTLIFFFIFAAIVFLIPAALVSAELASSMPDKGGVYHWMMRAFGDKMGMLSIWLQWINTMVWYPTILSFIAGIAAYLIHPELANNKIYLISVILTVFWGLTFINLFGLELSARVNSVCGLIGTMFPMLLLILLAIVWLWQGNTPQIDISWSSSFPSLRLGTSWVSLTAIMASFLGIELSGVHVGDIHNPQRNFPKALGYSSTFLVLTMLFGSLAIAFVLPVDRINLVSGVMQVFTNFFEVFHMEWAIPILAILILIGSIGGIINWLISPAKGLLHAAEYGFLHPFFSRKNRYGVAYNVLLAQALLVTLLCLVFFLVPSVNAFYWFLTGLSTDLYILMYILMFFSALKLHYTFRKRPLAFRVPGKKCGMWITCMLGIFGCVVTLIISFIPPVHIDIRPVHYALLIAVGNILMILPVFLFYAYRGRQKRPPKSPRIEDTAADTKGRPIGT